MKKGEILKQTEMLLKSVDWWEERSKEVFKKVDEIEKKMQKMDDLPFDEQEEIRAEGESVIRELSNLIQRGNVEEKETLNLQKIVENS